VDVTSSARRAAHLSDVPRGNRLRAPTQPEQCEAPAAMRRAFPMR